MSLGDSDNLATLMQFIKDQEPQFQDEIEIKVPKKEKLFETAIDDTYYLGDWTVSIFIFYLNYHWKYGI